MPIFDKPQIDEIIHNGTKREHIKLEFGFDAGSSGADYHRVRIGMTNNDIKDGLQINSYSQDLEEKVTYYNDGKINLGITALAKTHMFLLRAGDLLKSPFDKRDYDERMIDRASRLHKFYNNGTEFSQRDGLKQKDNKQHSKPESLTL